MYKIPGNNLAMFYLLHITSQMGCSTIAIIDNISACITKKARNEVEDV